MVVTLKWLIVVLKKKVRPINYQSAELQFRAIKMMVVELLDSPTNSLKFVPDDLVLSDLSKERQFLILVNLSLFEN